MAKLGEFTGDELWQRAFYLHDPLWAALCDSGLIDGPRECAPYLSVVFALSLIQVNLLCTCTISEPDKPVRTMTAAEAGKYLKEFLDEVIKVASQADAEEAEEAPTLKQ